MNIKELDNFNLNNAVKFNDELNPNLWDASEHLKPEIREQLLKIAADFQESLGVEDIGLKDITVSGSNAAYTYTPHSDIDLHLVVDLPHTKDNEVYKELFDAKKFAYNQQHDIKIKGHPVELYVQDANEPHYSQGIYSLLDQDWLSVPKRQSLDVDDSSVKSKFDDIKHRIKEAIASADYDTINNVHGRIKKMRQCGLKKNGEFGVENLTFKMLRNEGWIERLIDARNQAKNKQLSLIEKNKKKPKRVYGFKSPELLQSDVTSTWDGVSSSSQDFLNEQENLPNENSLGEPIANDPESLRNFWRWFKGSKVVDNQGRPLVVYHGSGVSGIQTFNTSNYETIQRGDWGKGIYFTPSLNSASYYRDEAVKTRSQAAQDAWDEMESVARSIGTSIGYETMAFQDGKITQEQYDTLKELDRKWRAELKKARESSEGEVYSVYLKILNPYVYTYEGITDPDLAQQVQQAGYDGRSKSSDGLMIQNQSGHLEEIIVFKPTQIKSSTSNRGSFKRFNTKITHEDVSSTTDEVSPQENLPNENSLGEPIANDPVALRNFWQWFGNSKVVDTQGRPMVVYHGTDKKFTKINVKRGAQGIFWFASDKQAIEAGEVGAAGTGVIMELYIKIDHPAGWKEYDQLLLDEFKSRGYDGAILPENDGTLVGFIFNANQVKSAKKNKGTYSGTKITDEDVTSTWDGVSDSSQMFLNEREKLDNHIQKVIDWIQSKIAELDEEHEVIEEALNLLGESDIVGDAGQQTPFSKGVNPITRQKQAARKIEMLKL